MRYLLQNGASVGAIADYEETAASCMFRLVDVNLFFQPHCTTHALMDDERSGEAQRIRIDTVKGRVVRATFIT